MTIEFRCPTCEKKLKTSGDKAGAAAKCPQCGSAVLVPAGSTEAANPSEHPSDFGDFEDTGRTFAPVTAQAGREVACPMCGAKNDSAAARCYACGEELWTVSHDGPTQPGARRFGAVWRTAWEKWTANLGICVAAAAITGGMFFAAYLGFIFLMMMGIFGLGAGGAMNNEAAAVVAMIAMAGFGYLMMFLVYTYILTGLSSFAIHLIRERETGLGALFPPVGKAVQSLVCSFFIVLGMTIAMVPGGAMYGFGLMLAEQNEPVGLVLAILGYFVMFVGWGLGWTLFWPVHYSIADRPTSLLAPLGDGVRLAIANPKLSFLLALCHTGLLLGGLMTCYVGLLFSMPLSFLLFAVAYDRCVKAARIA